MAVKTNAQIEKLMGYRYNGFSHLLQVIGNGRPLTMNWIKGRNVSYFEITHAFESTVIAKLSEAANTVEVVGGLMHGTTDSDLTDCYHQACKLFEIYNTFNSVALITNYGESLFISDTGEEVLVNYKTLIRGMLNITDKQVKDLNINLGVTVREYKRYLQETLLKGYITPSIF